MTLTTNRDSTDQTMTRQQARQAAMNILTSFGLQVQNVKAVDPKLTINAKECPECGGDLDADGECEDCDYVENANPEGHNQYSGGGSGSHKIVRESNGKAWDGDSWSSDHDDAKLFSSKEAAQSHLDKQKGLSAAMAGGSAGFHDARVVTHNAQPRHLESQQFLNKLGTSKKQVHGQVQSGYTGTDVDPLEHEDAEDEFDTEDLHQPELEGGVEDDDATINANPEGHNQYSGAARDASKKAMKVSGGGIGLKASTPEEHSAAAGEHAKQASLHLEKSVVKGKVDKTQSKAYNLHSLAAKAHSQAAKATTNAFGQSPDVRDEEQPPKFDPHKATKEAAAASLHTDHPKAFGRAQFALKASKDQDSPQAAGFHAKAANQHQMAATQARKDGDEDEAQSHDNAAALHMKAASMHQAQVENSSMVRNDFNSDEQRIGFFAGGPGEGASQKTVDKHAATGTASASADKSSKKAEKTGKKKDHEAASMKHGEAADYHGQMGNSKKEKLHKEAAKYHSYTASRSTNNRGTMTANMRKNAVEHLINNCGCEETDRQALNSLSDKALMTAVRNAMDDEDDDYDDDVENDGVNGKATGSNADATGSGSIQAGGEEDVADELNRIAPQLKGGKTVKSPATNQRKGMADYVRQHGTREDQEAWANVVTANADVKGQLIKQIIVNVRDKDQRKAMFSKLMKKPTAELREMLSLIPQTHNAEPERQPLFMGAGSVYDIESVTGNQAGDDEDVLPPPTMNWDEERELAEATA